MRFIKLTNAYSYEYNMETKTWKVNQDYHPSPYEYVLADAVIRIRPEQIHAKATPEDDWGRCEYTSRPGSTVVLMDKSMVWVGETPEEIDELISNVKRWG